MTFTMNDSPAAIVKEYPYASDLFKENRIDYCCGGERSLLEQFQANGVEGDLLLERLNKDYATWKAEGNVAKDWDALPFDELVDHIVYEHHAYLNEELPALSEYVTRIF